MSEQLKGIMNAYKEQMLKDTNETLDKVFAGLVETVRDTVPRLPEEIFVRYFLPYFAGHIKNTDRPQILAEWISIAGTPMGEVAVIDPAGTILFYVPPVFDTSFLSVAPAKGDNSFADIATNANLLSAHIPVRGLEYQKNAMHTRLGDLITSPQDVKYNEGRWLDIFSRYGINIPKIEAQTVNQPASNIADDEIYD